MDIKPILKRKIPRLENELTLGLVSIPICFIPLGDVYKWLLGGRGASKLELYIMLVLISGAWVAFLSIWSRRVRKLLYCPQCRQSFSFSEAKALIKGNMLHSCGEFTENEKRR
ncbi:MAG: hypothetical protein SFY81_07760 [Verrucomicrobiota bacterium]|nr:hypothetical protein [Verrucomicrobiota bacterium]